MEVCGGLTVTSMMQLYLEVKPQASVPAIFLLLLLQTKTFHFKTSLSKSLQMNLKWRSRKVSLKKYNEFLIEEIHKKLFNPFEPFLNVAFSI